MTNFKLEIPQDLEEFREGLVALHELNARQNEWIQGREVMEHARRLLHRDPTVLERVFIWIVWPGGLQLFWKDQSPEYVAYLRTTIQPVHFNLYQILSSEQDPDHQKFLVSDFGYSPKDENLRMRHFVRHTAFQFRRRLGPAIGSPI